MIEINGLRIDDDALFSIAHTCDPERFGPRCVCCLTYEVCVSQEEIPHLEGCIAVAISQGLTDAGAANMIDETDDGEYALDADEDGRCLLANPQQNGSSYCALHTAAMQVGLEPYTHKPQACALWPLALSEEADPVLGITEDAFDFPCNSPRHATNTLDAGIAQILDALYGPELRDRVEAVHSPRR